MKLINIGNNTYNLINKNGLEVATSSFTVSKHYPKIHFVEFVRNLSSKDYTEVVIEKYRKMIEKSDITYKTITRKNRKRKLITETIEIGERKHIWILPRVIDANNRDFWIDYYYDGINFPSEQLYYHFEMLKDENIDWKYHDFIYENDPRYSYYEFEYGGDNDGFVLVRNYLIDKFGSNKSLHRNLDHIEFHECFSCKNGYRYYDDCWDCDTYVNYIKIIVKRKNIFKEMTESSAYFDYELVNGNYKITSTDLFDEEIRDEEIVGYIIETKKTWGSCGWNLSGYYRHFDGIEYNDIGKVFDDWDYLVSNFGKIDSENNKEFIHSKTE